MLQATAQNQPKKAIDIQKFIDELFSIQDPESNINYEDLYESLYQLYLEPLDLNRASREDLSALFILSEIQINSFFEHVRRNGKLLSIYELQSIANFDLLTINRLLPFVKIDDSGAAADNRPLWQRIISEPNNYFFIRAEQVLEQRRGYTAPTFNSRGEPSQRYQGSPMRLYGRFRTSHTRDFSLGFTFEKDPGEQIIWDPSTRRYGMDFYSMHAFFENKGRFKSIALGDFQMQVGQSIILAAGFNIGKGAETVNTIRRSNLGLRPFTSVLESGFFRGAGLTYQLGKNRWGSFEATGFASMLRRDANLLTAEADSLDQEELFISSIQETGFHRTPNEIRAKGNILELVFGGNVGFTSHDKRLQIGATMVHTQFDRTLRRNPTLYNQFEFNGRENYVYGMNYSYAWQNFNFFGEVAQSKSGGVGLNSGFVSSLTPTLAFAFQIRSFDRDFHSFYGSALSEGSRNINERGTYWGIKYTPSRKWNFAAYYDRFRFPWLRFRVDAPSEGFEYLGRISYAPSRRITLFAQFREEVKQENIRLTESNLNVITDRIRRNWILSLDYRAEKILQLKTRVQFSTFDRENVQTSGYALIQDINVDLGKWEFSARAALFDTEDFENRQFVFEKDVLYAFSIPAYQDRGVRNYLLVEYKPTRKLTFWGRYAITRLVNRDTIGTALELIEGNTRSEATLQMRIKF